MINTAISGCFGYCIGFCSQRNKRDLYLMAGSIFVSITVFTCKGWVVIRVRKLYNDFKKSLRPKKKEGFIKDTCKVLTNQIPKVASFGIGFYLGWKHNCFKNELNQLEWLKHWLILLLFSLNSIKILYLIYNGNDIS